MKIIKILLILILLYSISDVHSQVNDWWKSAAIYQISPLSFKDTTGNGKGDIQGIISKLDYFVETGIDAILLCPFFKSTMQDFAYDISNYIQVDENFGSMKDAEELIAKAQEKGIKIILDFVPSHTSNKHEWFIKSDVKTRGYEDYYIWHDGIPQENEGRPLPPNDWKSEYGGSVWTWSRFREAYYFHKFSEFQPDLNLREKFVLDKLDEVLKFWLDKGVDGFRIDAASELIKDAAFNEKPDIKKDHPQTYELIERWRNLIDNYSKDGTKVLVPQVWNSPVENLMRYYQNENGTHRAQIPMNFMLINELNKGSSAADFKKVIETYLSSLPNGAIGNWFLGTHGHNRVASRMGKERIDGLMILLQTLPGISFTYYGDEIGMEDYMDISWHDTQDIQACNAGRNTFQTHSRDVARTPFQWDKSANGGFSSGKPWLPVHPGYLKSNLESQMSADKSHYKLFKELIKLRKNEAFIGGAFEVKVLGHNVLAYSRSNENKMFAVAINIGNKDEKIDLSVFKVPTKENMIEYSVHLAAVNSKHNAGDKIDLKNLQLSPYDAVVIKYSSATKMTSSFVAISAIIVKLLF